MDNGHPCPSKVCTSGKCQIAHSKFVLAGNPAGSPPTTCAHEILSVDVNEAITHTIFQHRSLEACLTSSIRPEGGGAELCRPVEDDDEENSVILGAAVRVWDENRLPRVVLLLVPDLQAAMGNFVLELKFVKTLSSVESQTFFFTKY